MAAVLISARRMESIFPVDYLNLVYCKDVCNDPSLLIHLKILDVVALCDV